MKGYKDYKLDIHSREEQADITESDMHFCKSILDALDYYSLIDGKGDIVKLAEVEALGKIEADVNSYCATSFKTLERLSLIDLIKIGVGELKRDCSRLALDEDYAKLLSKDSLAKLASSGYSAKVIASGEYSKISTSGNYSQIVALGSSSDISTSGDHSRVVVSGEYSRIAASGYGCQIWADGCGLQVVTSGDCCQISVRGENSVVSAIGVNSIVKGIKGTWISIAEYEEIDDRYMLKAVKSAQIDGRDLREDTWYCLKGGNFREVEL